MEIAATAAAVTTGWAYLDARFHLSKDWKSMRGRRAVENLMTKHAKQDRLSPYYLFESSALRRPDVEAIWTRTASFTWSDVLTLANAYGNFFLSRGVEPGHLVALCMQNSPDFVFAWLGLWSVGAAPAMINYNLSGDALVGCLKTSTAKMLLVDGPPDVRQRVEDSRGPLQELGFEIVDVEGEIRPVVNAAREPQRPGDHLRRGIKPHSPMGLFYTSGTTGLPKACVLPVAAAYGLALGNDLGLHPTRHQDERCYCCMPFYHGTGGIITMSQILAGSTVCIAPKFSASSFWPDIRASNSTWFLYVGETLRYLLSAPPSPSDRDHAVHAVYGNGCRPDVWTRFQDRFGIDTICEFYNSTEGSLALKNAARGPFLANSLGHHGLLERRRYRDMLVPVVVDADSGDIVRDGKTGLAVRAPYHVGGEILVAMPGERPFPGYFGDEAATEKKFVRDVLEKGDKFYRTGDAMRRDDDGRWFFLDRLGDTFRWKGENVSTAEVSQVLGRYPGVAEAIVYGVPLPGHDGKAGAAALHINPTHESSFDFAQLLAYARSKLPKYAVPVFVRVLKQQTASHNNKQNKAPLKKAGADPDLVEGDELLWVAERGKGATYVPFTKEDWDRLGKGKARL